MRTAASCLVAFGLATRRSIALVSGGRRAS
jgi:hypothetical protein